MDHAQGRGLYHTGERHSEGTSTGEVHVIRKNNDSQTDKERQQRKGANAKGNSIERRARGGRGRGGGAETKKKEKSRYYVDSSQRKGPPEERALIRTIGAGKTKRNLKELRKEILVAKPHKECGNGKRKTKQQQEEELRKLRERGRTERKRLMAKQFFFT